MIEVIDFLKNRGNMQLIKEVSGLIGLVIVMLALMGHLDKTYATKYSVTENVKRIKVLETKAKNNGAILCGIAIDLKLPTARRECDNIINN